jgi:hypothetical protein
MMEVAGIGMGSNIHHNTHKAETAPAQQACAPHPEKLIAAAIAAASNGPAISAQRRADVIRMN